jgi:hypothetical protein
MPRLKDLLEFLAAPGLEDIWILLDIKIHDDPDDMMRLLADTLADVKPTKPWEQRVVLGIWTVSSTPLETLLRLRLRTTLGKLSSSVFKISTWIPDNAYQRQHCFFETFL